MRYDPADVCATAAIRIMHNETPITRSSDPRALTSTAIALSGPRRLECLPPAYDRTSVPLPDSSGRRDTAQRSPDKFASPPSQSERDKKSAPAEGCHREKRVRYERR